MTDTILETERTNGGGTAPDIEVELWGPPGSGKSVVLASLYATLDARREVGDFYMSPKLRAVYEQLLKGQILDPTSPHKELAGPGREGEQLRVTLKVNGRRTNRVRVTSNAGEDLLSEGGVDVPSWIEQRRGKVVVVCLNPFLVDEGLALMGLQHMVAVLQGPKIGLSLTRAFQTAAWALLHVGPDILASRIMLMRSLQLFEGSKITYDVGEPEPEKRFKWEGVGTGNVEQLLGEWRELIDERVSLSNPMVNVVREALRSLHQSMVVLTHVDLVDALLPSITFSDFERIFNDLYEGRPERMVSQQVMARLFRISIVPPTTMYGGEGTTYRPAAESVHPSLAPFDGSGAVQAPASWSPQPSDNGSTPNPGAGGGDGVKGAIKTMRRKDGALELVNYLKAIAEGGVDKDAPATIIRLKGEVRTLKEERELCEQRRATLDAQVRAATTRADGLQTSLGEEKTRWATLDEQFRQVSIDLTSTKLQADKLDRDLKLAQAELERKHAGLVSYEQTGAEINRRLLELTRVADRVPVLEQEVQRHRDEYRNAGARVHDLESELEQLRRQRTHDQEAIDNLRMKLEAAGGAANDQEADQLRRKINSLEGDLETARDDASTNARKLKEALDKLASGAGEDQRKAKIEELKRQAQAAIAQRDAIIDQIRQKLVAKEEEISQLKVRMTELGGGKLSVEESRAREQYEAGRFGPTKQWAFLMIRSLPAMPIIALLTAGLLKLALGSTVTFNGTLFFATSVITLVVVGLGTLFAVAAQWAQLGPRWIWLRRQNTRTKVIETLTSGGEGVSAAPDSFTLHASPFLSLLGLGVIRRHDSGQRYVTTEPGTWLDAPVRPIIRHHFAFDLITFLFLVGWVAAIVWFFVKT